MGCSEVDPHVPKERVLQAAEALGRLGGALTVRLYGAMDHTINQDEIGFVRGMLRKLMAGSESG